METATLIKEFPVNKRNAKHKLYRLSDGGNVIVSAVVVFCSGPETYIFEADENGNVVNWTELEGSYKGGLCHRRALENAGYEVIE